MLVPRSYEGSEHGGGSSFPALTNLKLVLVEACVVDLIIWLIVLTDTSPMLVRGI